MATIYHNPRCSKSRQALDILRANNVDIKVILYLKEPMSASELELVLTKLGMTPGQLIRRNETNFKDLALDAISVTEQQLFEAMLTHPILIERPIVVVDTKAIIGRPPENVLGLL
jgi:arsenate reductase|tara:strand:+ start:624 stop:968 length:345 start_codon:yes stop_codon:yes gene_type:complete